jgi:hypothetical protein
MDAHLVEHLVEADRPGRRLRPDAGESAVHLGSVVRQLPIALVAQVGGAAPEIVLTHVGQREREALVPGVVVGAVVRHGPAVNAREQGIGPPRLHDRSVGLEDVLQHHDVVVTHQDAPWYVGLDDHGLSNGSG